MARQTATIRLKKKWMDNPKGSEMTISLSMARRLESQKVAKILDGEKATKKNKPETKQMGGPPKHRMLRGAPMIK